MLATEIDLVRQWYVLKSGKKYGPFAYLEMVHMMQNKTLFEFDYVWSQGMKAWSPLADTPEFTKETLTDFYKSDHKTQAFIKRAHPRVNFETLVMAHNNNSLWTGKTTQISEGGALLLMANPLLLPGQIIHINFKKTNPQDLSFNLVAEVLGKRYTKERIKHDTNVTYAVKFIRKDKAAEEQLNKWIDNQLKIK